jgi:hypothetical protein
MENRAFGKQMISERPILRWLAKSLLLGYLLIFRAIGFPCQPAYGSILLDRNDVDRASNVFGNFFVGGIGAFNDGCSEFGRLVRLPKSSAHENRCPMLPCGAEIGHNVQVLPTRTHSALIYLTAWPAVRQVAAEFVLNRIKKIARIENNKCNSDIASAADEHTGRELAKVGTGEAPRLLAINIVPTGLNATRPISSNSIDIHLPTLFSRNRPDGVLGQFSVVPNNDVPLSPSSRPNTGEYQLMAKCRNLAVRVVWSAGIVVYGQAVGGHDKFVLREIENDDRPRKDLGQCVIGYKQDKYQKVFRHVTLSSGEASLLGFDFDKSEEKAPACLGCTLVVSQDGRAWYEIIAIQEAHQSTGY